MNSTKDAHEFTEEKLERRAGGLEGWGSGRSVMIHASAVHFLSAFERIYMLQALRPRHEDLGESELPGEW